MIDDGIRQARRSPPSDRTAHPRPTPARWLFLASSLLMFGCGGPAALEPTTPPSPFTFTHVTVIDATGAAPQPDMTVAIGEGRIRSIDEPVSNYLAEWQDDPRGRITQRLDCEFCGRSDASY